MLPRSYHHFRRILPAAILVVLSLGFVACAVDNSFDPVPPGGRREIYGDLGINTQLEADNLVGIRKVVGNLHISGQEITHLTGLQDLREVTGTLTVHGCPELEHLDSLSELETIGELRIVSCNRIKDLDELRNVHGAKGLEITNCDSLAILPSGDFVRHLESCRLNRLPGLQAIASLADMGELTVLNLDNLPESLDYTPLGRLTSLTELTLRGLPLTELPDISRNTFLDRVTLHDLPQLTTFAGLDLPYVRMIYIYDCPLPTSLAGIGPCPELESLGVSECDGLMRLDTGSTVGEMSFVSIRECDGLRDLTGFGADWFVLRVSSCDSFAGLAGLTAGSALTGLELSSLPELASLAGFPAGHELRNLEVSFCKQFAAVGEVTIAPDGVLRLIFLAALTDLGGLVIPESLDILELYGVDIPDLAELAPLQLADRCLIGSTPLTSLAGLENLRTVESVLSILGNHNLANISALQGVVSAGSQGVQFADNPLLDTCAVEEMVAGWAVSGEVLISGNGPCAD